MERRELEDLVARGEGQQLEFKKRTPEPRRLAKEVIALIPLQNVPVEIKAA